MNVLIAKTKEECAQWPDVAVVVDVLRTATTLCALLKRGKKDVLVFARSQEGEAFAAVHPEFEVYSNLPLSVPHRDNSPYLADKSSAKQPALLVTEDGTRALMSLSQAALVLAGGFCNFGALADVLTEQEKDILLVPASLFGVADEVEDNLCASALKDYLQGIGRPEAALGEFTNTMRYGEFMKQGPKTAAKDAKFAFRLNGLKTVPQITFSKEGYGVCHAFGTPAPQEWVNPAAVVRPAEEIPAAPVQKAAPLVETETKSSGSTSSKIKSFFSGILQAAKEEKEELKKLVEPETRSAVPAAAAPKNDDLLDSVLKQAQSAPAKQTAQAASVAQAAVPSAQVPVGKPKKKAIVLFSGGLDSTTCLYWALDQGYECEALTVSYGQRHDREVLAAQTIARRLGVKHHMITLNLPWLSCCSLVDKKQTLPDVALEDIPKEGIPSTYVPGRNLMFLSIAGSMLDAIGADAIIAGPNAIDFSGYPDCTPAFFKAAAEALNRGTKRGVTEGIEVLAPLMRLSKTDIVRLAAKLKVPFELTWSCYAGGKKPCGHCDSCKLRAKGFAEAGVHDTSLD